MRINNNVKVKGIRAGKAVRKTICMVLAGAMLITSCGIGGSTGADAKSSRAKLKVNKRKVSVKAGCSVKVGYRAPGKIKAVSSKKKVARVTVTRKNVVIRGIKKGKAVVTVSCNKKKAEINVTVKKKSVPVCAVTPVPTPEATADPDNVRNASRELSPLASAVNKFGMQVYNGVRTDGDNSFISSFSIYTALAMLANGADGNARTELLNTLGITDLDKVNSMMKTYCSGSMDEAVIFNIANSVWLGKSLIPSGLIENKFINPLMDNYNSEVYRDIDFSASDTVDRVNGWVDKKTNGMIKKIIDQTSAANTAAMIMNALYFQGRWKESFAENNTVDEPFNGVDGSKNVKMMTKTYGSYNYFNNGTFKGIELPFGRKSAYAMDIIMTSDDKVGTTEKWKTLTADEQVKQIMEFDNLATYKNTRLLKLPRFNMDFSAGDSLKAALGNMGIKEVFTPGANLSNIGNDIYVSRIIHKTALEVNEEGSKAAAVTAIAMEVTAAYNRDAEEIEFVVNRPFVVAIRDKVSGMVLFIGEVNKL